ncbi:FAD/NAD(P)-binding protein [Actinomadura macra]|uniref:FAD/NAD(P)-binding protein n=1 Tax=Actinomadura macra TaxID=46164 RepID=UPI000B1BE484|nr:FAD/NAD(P)-binding protein [Actinomadura macra]
MGEFAGRSGSVPVVAIVGGGASGTLTAAHLLLRGRGPGVSPRVILIDQYGRHGLGQAYATTDSHHLLNVCATRMSALEGDPDHLLRWVRAQGQDVTGADYIPRRLYGRYLRAVLAEARRAWPAGHLTQLTGTVTSLREPGQGRPIRLTLSDGGRLDADAVVLATGNRPPAALRGVPAGPRCVPDPWVPDALTGICDGSPVLVAGTGLTMVDIAITVTRTHPGSVVFAVSRHGLLPRTHRPLPPPPADVRLPAHVQNLAGLMRALRVAVKDNGGEWQGVVDALRPHVPRLWGGLSTEDKRRFLDLVARYWEIHRHRIPPATASRIAHLRATGRLRVLRGRVGSAVADRDGVTVAIDAEAGTRELRVGWLVNGTGPASDVAGVPFLDELFTNGTARPDPLRLGLDADAAGAVLDAAGRPHERIFTLGPTLRGLRYETTAIPEIRAQAAALASRLDRMLTPGNRWPDTSVA